MPNNSDRIIDRTMNQELKDLLEKFSEVIDNLVDFGAQIYSWDIDQQIEICSGRQRHESEGIGG